MWKGMPAPWRWKMPWVRFPEVFLRWNVKKVEQRNKNSLLNEGLVGMCWFNYHIITFSVCDKSSPSCFMLIQFLLFKKSSFVYFCLHKQYSFIENLKNTEKCKEKMKSYPCFCSLKIPTEVYCKQNLYHSLVRIAAIYQALIMHNPYSLTVTF